MRALLDAAPLKTHETEVRRDLAALGTAILEYIHIAATALLDKAAARQAKHLALALQQQAGREALVLAQLGRLLAHKAQACRHLAVHHLG